MEKSLRDVYEICWNLTEDEKFDKCYEGKELTTVKIKRKENKD